MRPIAIPIATVMLLALTACNDGSDHAGKATVQGVDRAATLELARAVGHERDRAVALDMVATLAKSPDSATLPVYATLLHDWSRDLQFCEAVLAAIGADPSREASRALCDALGRYGDEQQLKKTCLDLLATRNNEAVPCFVSYMRDEGAYMDDASVEAMRMSNAPQIMNTLVSLYRNHERNAQYRIGSQ